MRRRMFHLARRANRSRVFGGPRPRGRSPPLPWCRKRRTLRGRGRGARRALVSTIGRVIALETLITRHVAQVVAIAERISREGRLGPVLRFGEAEKLAQRPRLRQRVCA